MKITITMEALSTGKTMDIQIEQSQRIKTTLRVLTENKKDFLPRYSNSVVRLKDSGRRISIEQTYEEASIYTGAQLVLEDIENA